MAKGGASLIGAAADACVEIRRDTAACCGVSPSDRRRRASTGACSYDDAGIRFRVGHRHSSRPARASRLPRDAAWITRND
ncbi:hypothetical protein DM992_07485 [Burkholderia sp. JP2-270]|nr:hypothetical protein DM992_07485 [Burkholderia sp. JP2-270]